MNTIWAIDVGNTHTKIAIIQETTVKEVFRFRTHRDRAVDEYYFQLKNICHDMGTTTIPPLWISSVVPAVSIALERLAQKRNLEMHFIHSKYQFGFEIDPAIISQVGTDILILTEAAVKLLGENVIIVSAGTATVIFVVHKGILKGGAIAPGIKGSVESLIEKASLLNPVMLDPPDQAIGQTTDDAMKSGIVFGFAGLVDSLVSRIRKELQQPEMPVIACGGMIELVAKVSHTISQVQPELGLYGIALLAEKNGDKDL